MAFDLKKGVEQAEGRFKAKGFNLRKDGRGDGLAARVMAVMDGSGSAKELWLSGTMQEAIQLVLPTAVLIDDDGQLPVAVFNDGDNFTIVGEPMTQKNYDGYVERNIVTRRGQTRISLFGGTDYSPVLKALLRQEGVIQDRAKPGGGGFLSSWFGGGSGGGTETAYVSDPKASPIVVEFFTDGDCSNGDESVTADLLASLEQHKCKVYVLFVGVGTGSSFRYIKRLADDRGNVGFTSIKDLRSAVGSDSIMEQLLPDELLAWLKK